MVRASILNVIAQAVSLAVSIGDRIVLVGILVRIWGPHLYSDWLSITAAAGLLSLAELGFQVQYGNRLSRHFLAGETQEYGRLIGVGLAIYGTTTLLLLFAVAAFATWSDFPKLLHLQALSGDASKLVFLLMAAASIMRLARACLSQIYRSRGEFHRGVVLDTVVTGLTIGFAVTAGALRAGPVTVAFAYLGAELLFGWLGMTVDLKRRYSDLVLRPEVPRPAELKDLGRSMGWYALLAGLPTAWLYVPVIVLGALRLGGAGLVSFTIQRSMINFGRSLGNLVSMGVGVELATVVNNPAAVSAGIGVLARANAGLAGLLAGAVISLGPEIVRIWTGNAALASLPLLLAFVAPAILIAPTAPLNMLCMYADRPRPAGIAVAAQLGIAVAAALVGGRLLGVEGVALGIGVGEVIGALVVLPLLASPYFPIRFWRLAIACWAISIAIAVFGAIVGWILLRILEPLSPASLIAALGCWGCVLAAPAMVLSLPIHLRRALFGRAVAMFQRAQ